MDLAEVHSEVRLSGESVSDCLGLERTVLPFS